MTPPPPRIATLVLVDAAGRMLGSLAPFEAATPWWMDAAPLLQAVQDRDGLPVTILRLLSAERAVPHGGAVCYLAQADAPVPAALLRPWAGVLTDHPLRQPWARVGGPQADLAWAHATLAAQGLAMGGAPRQQRSWNLSSVWQLPLVGGGEAWLKVVPPFFAHEGAMLALLAGAGGAALAAGAPVPRLLGRDGGRVLLAGIAGEDLHEAGQPQQRAMIDLLVALQASLAGRVDELLALGLPDWRGPALTASVTALLQRRGAELPAPQRELLETFVDGLPARFAAIAACGLPDTLVHGDFHRGNFRGRGRSITLLDWGDSGVGHPLLDQPAFCEPLPAADAEAARRHWPRAWQRALRGRHQQPPTQADVARAAKLLAPVASARQALIYQRFLDQIEDSEQPYHRADVLGWLRRTAQRLAAD